MPTPVTISAITMVSRSNQNATANVSLPIAAQVHAVSTIGA